MYVCMNIHIYTHLCACVFYDALQHFIVIYGANGNRCISRTRQSMGFPLYDQNTLRPLLKGHILQCLLCTGTVPWPVVTLLATNLSISVCIHTTFFEILKDLILHHLRPLNLISH